MRGTRVDKVAHLQEFNGWKSQPIDDYYSDGTTHGSYLPLY